MKLTFWIVLSCLFLTISKAENSNESGGTVVTKLQKTRYGDVSLVSNNEMPADKIMFHGKTVFEDSGMYISLFGYFQLKDSDAILIGSNSGGSSTPETAMTFLVINSEGIAHTISDPSFVATSESEIHARKIKGNRVSVSLGYHSGAETIAELENGKLTMKSVSRRGRPMSSNACQDLYQLGSRVCKHDGTNNSNCRNGSSSTEAGIDASISDMGSFNYFSNQPGFVKVGFIESCAAWCKGKTVEYRDFKKSACSIK